MARLTVFIESPVAMAMSLSVAISSSNSQCGYLNVNMYYNPLFSISQQKERKKIVFFTRTGKKKPPGSEGGQEKRDVKIHRMISWQSIGFPQKKIMPQKRIFLPEMPFFRLFYEKKRKKQLFFQEGDLLFQKFML